MPADSRRRARSGLTGTTGFKHSVTTPATAKLAALLLTLLIAFAAAGCGDEKTASEESLPDRPKLTVPNGSVAADKDADGDVTDATGETGSGTGSDQTTTDSGSGGTTVPQNTGGQGTGTDQGAGQTTPQDTGGAAPGN